mmetsp:Transcript_42328/g.135524  ORF Transcript_42328/g.135524 Transcript_42328/m.135524 type:complete len:362 (-) Transcript_42328:229-1314(-)
MPRHNIDISCGTNPSAQNRMSNPSTLSVVSPQIPSPPAPPAQAHGSSARPAGGDLPETPALQQRHLAELAEDEEPRLELAVGSGHAPVAAEVLLLAAAHQPLVVHDAHLVQAALVLLTLPAALAHLVAREALVDLLHRPEELLVHHRAILAELPLPPLARAEHGVAVRLVVVLRGRLGVSLEGDGHHDVAAGHAHKLADHSVGLVGVDVLKHIGGVDEVEGVVLEGEVSEEAGLDPPLLQHVGALLLEDGPRELNAEGGLAVGAHQADQGAVAGASVEHLVKLDLGNDVAGEAAAPAGLRGVTALGPRLVVELLVRVGLVHIPAAALRRLVIVLRAEELRVLHRGHGEGVMGLPLHLDALA